MNILENIIKIRQLSSPQGESSLKKRVRQHFTPRLWGSTLIERRSLEGGITEFVREWTRLDNEKVRWNKLFSDFFHAVETTKPAAFQNLSVADKAALYELRSVADTAHTDPQSIENALERLKKTLRENDNNTPTAPPPPKNSLPVHWTHDPVILHQFSLLRNDMPEGVKSTDVTILQALFGLEIGQALYDDRDFFTQLLTGIDQRLEMCHRNPELSTAATATSTLMEQAKTIEDQLQSILPLGSCPADHGAATTQLEELARTMANAVESLKIGEKYLFFGGLEARAPKLNLSSPESTDFGSLLNQLFDKNAAQQWIVSIVEILEDIDFSNVKIPESAHKKLQEVIGKGLVSAILPGVTQSLLHPDQNLPTQALLAIPELMRVGANMALNSLEKEYIDSLAGNFTAQISQDFQSELSKSLQSNTLGELLRQKLIVFLDSELKKAHKDLVDRLMYLPSLLPDFVLEMISAFGYGDLGHPAVSYWFEFSRQDDSYEPYTLELYATGGGTEPSLPVRYSQIGLKKLDADFFLRLLTYRVGNKWNPKTRHDVKDFKGMLNERLKSSPQVIESSLETIQDEPKRATVNWNLIKSFLTTHVPFSTKKERILFFFHWKRDYLVGFFKELQERHKASPVSSKEFSVAYSAVELLASEAVSYFEAGFLDIEDLKQIYATMWEMKGSFKSPQTSSQKPSHEYKSQILPPEIAAHVQSLFHTCGLQNADLLKKILIDALGPQVEEGLDELLADFGSTPMTPSSIAPPPPFSFSGFGTRVINVLLDATVGINLDDVTSPTFFSYIKITATVARLGLSCLFPGFAISLNLKWTITLVAKEALFEMLQRCFPEQMGQLRRMQTQLQEWGTRLFTQGIVAILLSDDQRQALADTIQKWQQYLTSSAPLSFDLPEFSPAESNKFSLHKITPIALAPVVAPPKEPQAPAIALPPITAETCIAQIEEWNAEAKQLMPTAAELQEIEQIKGTQSHEAASGALLGKNDVRMKKWQATAIYSLEKMKALPVPSAENIDCWSEVENPLKCLEAISNLALKLYSSVLKAKCSVEMRNQTLVQLYKSYAIIDVLARRCPESLLEGYASNAWALALIKEDAFFHVFDPQVREEFNKICQYFGIERDKKYSPKEIESQQGVLFRDLETANEGTLHAPTPATRSFWNTLGGLAKTITGEDIGLSYKEPVSDPEKHYYEMVLNEPQVKALLAQQGLQDAHILEKIALVTADPKQVFLSKAFHLFRLAGNLLANEFTTAIFCKDAGIDIKDLNFSPIDFKKQGNSLREGLSQMPFIGDYCGKSQDSKVWNHVPGNYATIEKKGHPNAAREDLIASPAEFSSLASCESGISWENSSYNAIAILHNYLHLKPRPQNEIINEPSTFDKLRVCADPIFSKYGNKVYDNTISSLPPREREAVESLFTESNDQVVRVLSYFKLNYDRLTDPSFFLLFQVLLLRDNLLDKQLKGHPAFVHTLGDFFKKAFEHFSAKEDCATQYKLIKVAILCLVLAKAIYPDAAKDFPDLSDYLWGLSKFSTAEMDRSIPATLLVHPHFFVNPTTATAEEKKRACIDCCRSLMLESSAFTRPVYAETIAKWKPTIQEILNSDAKIRSEILSEYAKMKNLKLPKKELHWEGNFPRYTLGHFSVTLCFEQSTILGEDDHEGVIRTRIVNALTAIYSSKMPPITKIRSDLYAVNEDNISIEIKISKSNATKLRISRKENNLSYRLVAPSFNSTTPASPEKSYWLYDNPAISSTKLLIAEEGKVFSIENLAKQPDGSYVIAGENCTLGEEIDLIHEPHGLGTLATFQSLSKIKAFRSATAPFALHQIAFTDLDLAFTITEINAQKVAVNTKEIPGYFIALDQKQEKQLPVLKYHTQYLLLENVLGQKKIVLPKESINTSIISCLLQKLVGISTSRLMETQLNHFSSLFGFIFKESSKYYVYTADKEGRLTSESPEALLHLLLYSLAQGQLSEIAYYLDRVEEIGLRLPYPEAVFTMMAGFEAIAAIARDPTYTRIALRLAAVREKNQLNQIHHTPGTVTKQALISSWLSLQANLYLHTRQRDTLPHLPFTEYHEYYVLHSIIQKGKELLTGGVNQLSTTNKKDLQLLIGAVGEETVTENLMLLPQLSKRYTFLSAKYAIPGEKSSSHLRDLAAASLNDQASNIDGLMADKGAVAIGSQINLTQQGSAIQKLCEYLGDFSDCSLTTSLWWMNSSNIFDNIEKLTLDLSSGWKKVPIHFTQLTKKNLVMNFAIYYQLAYGSPPLNCKKDSDEEAAFFDKSKKLKKALQLAHGNTPSHKQLIKTLKLVANPSSISTFPNPQEIEEHLQDFNEEVLRLEDRKAIAEKKVLDTEHASEEAKKALKEAENALDLLILYGSPGSSFYLPLTSLLGNIQAGKRKESTLKVAIPFYGSILKTEVQVLTERRIANTAFQTLSSLTNIAISPQIATVIHVAKHSYNGLKAIYYLFKQNQKLNALRAVAREERLSLDNKNNQVEAPLPISWAQKFSNIDAALGAFFSGLLGRAFSNSGNFTEDASGPIPIPAFKALSDDIFVQRRFDSLNESVDDFSKRKVPEKLPERIKDAESYYWLKVELEKGKRYLQKSLTAERKELLTPKQKPLTEVRPDEEVIPDLLKKSEPIGLQESPLTPKELFKRLCTAFTDDNDEALMKCAACGLEDLPKLKEALYLHLIKATRLQQIQRALERLEEIDPENLDNEKMQTLQKQLSSLLGTQRAFAYEIPADPEGLENGVIQSDQAVQTRTIPGRLLRGYLAFEYGTGTMLWERQVLQLQRMLLENHERSILELFTGCGKTFFGTPMTSFYGSNQKQVIHNCFPDALFFENTKDLSGRLYDVYGKFTNAINISRQNRPRVDNLWSLLRTHIEALDLGQPLNSCKKDLQTLELLFIEEAYASSKRRRPGDEQLLLYYMKLLHFIRTKEVGNIDEAHQLLLYSNERNHPLGVQKRIKPSYINVISECMRLLAASPAIVEMLAIQRNDQTLCDSQAYHSAIKPSLARDLAPYFKIKDDDQQFFIDYLCDKAMEIPKFLQTLTTSKKREDITLAKGIALARGVLNIILPDALGEKVNVHFGVRGNKHGYAQPYSSKDTPIEGSTFKNPYEAALKTLMAYLHLELTVEQTHSLVIEMESRATSQSKLRKIRFEDTEAAKIFRLWTKGRYELGQQQPFVVLTQLLNQSYGARLTYARFFPIAEIKYFSENACSNSQNYAAMFKALFAESASPPIQEVTPTGSVLLWDKGTAGEFIDFVCRTCTDDDITVIDQRDPKQALQEILGKLFDKNSKKRALIDAGALFYGLSNTVAAKIILAHAAQSNPDEIKAVVYFDENNQLVILERGKSVQPLNSSSIAPKNRITYYDNGHSVGADIKQAIGAGGVVTISEDTDFEQLLQGGGRMRGLKTAGQTLHVVTNSEVKRIITDKKNITIRDVIAFTAAKESERQKASVFPSTQQQLSNVLRRAVLDKVIQANDVNTMLNIFREFSSLFITKTVVNPWALYGAIRVEVPTKAQALPLLRKQHLAVIEGSSSFSTEEMAKVKEDLEEVGKNSLFSPTVSLAKSHGELNLILDGLNASQEVATAQENFAEAERDQSTEAQQQLQLAQNQNLQIAVNMNAGNPDSKLRLKPARWNPEKDYTSSLDWWKSMSKSDSSHDEAAIYSVKEALATSSNSALSAVKNAFEGLYWTNNLQGIIVNTVSNMYGIEYYTDLAEPLTKKPILELLVIQFEDEPLRTLAIDQKEGKFWRKYLMANQSNAAPSQKVRIGIFDLGLNAIVISGKNGFNQESLWNNKAFTLDIARWKFLAAHVNIDPDSHTPQRTQNTEPLLERFEKWIEEHNYEKMKTCYKEIYAENGFLPLDGSQIESIFSGGSGTFKEMM